MATFIINPNVNYAGKVLPRDKAAIHDQVTDPVINYAGKNLPGQAAIPALAPPDLTNNPSLIIIAGITLPPDTVFLINGEKILAIAKILDGVSVIQRISREAYEIEFEGTFRTTPDQGTSYVFPQDAISNYWSTVWLPDTVQTIKNTFLNKLGIQEIVVQKMHIATVRGSKNVPFKMRTIENVTGQSLIVNPG